MKVVVTGGEGFIGQHLLKELTRFSECWSVDINDNVKNRNYNYINCDVSSIDLIDHLNIIKPDYIFHLAAQTSSIISEETPIVDINTNIVGALNICSALKILPSTKLIFTSSMAVYGSNFVENQGSGPEANPLSVYGISKLSSEQLFLRLKKYNNKVDIYRLFNVYGEGQNLKNLKQGMLSIFCAMAIKDKKILVKGDKGRSRDFIHVKDVVQNLLKSLDNNLDSIKDIGTGRGLFVYQIADTIRDKCMSMFNLDIEIIYEEGFKEDIFHSKTRNPVQHNVKFEEGISNFLKWCYRELNND